MEQQKYKAPILKDKNGNQVVFSIKRANQYWLEKAREDIELYGELVFGLRPAAHHRRWLKTFTDPMQKFTLIVSSRGFGKTETVKLGLSWMIGRNTYDTNVITSVSKDQASKRLMDLKDVILFNPMYKAVFPHVKLDLGKPNTQSEFGVWDNRVSYNNYVRRRSQLGTAKTMSIFATGMGGKGLVGNRITGLAIVDDPHDEDAAFSPVTRVRAIDWYNRTFINCLTGSHAKVIVITTRWHEEDLAGDIIANKAKMYEIIDTPAEYMDESGKRQSNWSEFWPIEKLEAQEELIGTRMYRALYLNDIHAMSGDMFKVEWLNNQLPTPIPPLVKVIISVDPAVTVKTMSDYTAIALLGIDEHRNIYLLGLWRQKMHSKDLSIRLQTIYEDAIKEYGRCDKVIIEEFAQQTLLVDRLLDDTLLPIEGMSLKGDKATKAQSLEVVCSRGKFYGDWRETSWYVMPLRGEFLGFPNATKHDDMVDAIAQGTAYLVGRSGKLKAKLKTVTNPYVL